MSSNRLYARRTLSDTLNMVFDFVGENWRKWFKLMIYFLLPFSVLLGATIATFYKDTEEFTMSTMGYVVSIVLFIVGCAVVTALEILLVKWHEDHNGTLDGCDAAGLWRMMPKTSLKCLGIIVLWSPVVAMELAMILVPVIGLGFIFVMLPIFMTCPIMILESNNSISDMTKRAFSLGFKKWGTFILIAVVMVLVAVLINNAATFPLGLFKAFESLFEKSTTADSMLWSFLADVIRYVLCVAECFVVFVGIGMFVLAITFHYGSVATEAEDLGLESDIDDFAKLK